MKFLPVREEALPDFARKLIIHGVPCVLKGVKIRF